MPIHRKKRKFEMARQPSMTKMGEKSVRLVRGRGGNYKVRAMRLEEGNFTWGSECVSRKCKILDVVYNATSNELVRTKTLMKGCVVQIESTPLKSYFVSKYGMDMVDREQLTQQQHRSDYGTIEALQTWLTQQATDEASRHETTKDSRTMSRWCQQVERYRHSFLQWHANYSGQTDRLAVAPGDLEREGEANNTLDNGHQEVEEVTTGTCNVTVQPGESPEPPPSRTDTHRIKPSLRPPRRVATSRKRNYCKTEQCTRPMDSKQPHGTERRD